jgi:hypothetical protein
LNFHAGDDHVADADGDAGLGGVEEAEFLQLIEHQNGLLRDRSAGSSTARAAWTPFFLSKAVDEGHLRRQVIVEDHAADGGVQELLGSADGSVCETS